jgi:molecular chaperone GrpE
MPQDGRDLPGREGAGGEVKVVDRRRFRQDGDPVEGAPNEEATPEPGVAEPQPEPESDPRDAQLAGQAARIDELTRAYAALVEDNKSFRARLEREQARVVEAERTSVAQALLEATDDLERALAAVAGSAAGAGQGDALRVLAEGVRLSLASLHRRIQSLGAERIAVVGQRFDPRLAEAIDAVPVADVEQDELVLQEVRSGYRIGERILRPARVRVGRLARA